MKSYDLTIEGKACIVERGIRWGRPFASVLLKARKGDGLILLATDDNEACAIRVARRKILMGGAP